MSIRYRTFLRSLYFQNNYWSGQYTADNGDLFTNVKKTNALIILFKATKKSPVGSGLGNRKDILKHVVFQVKCLEDYYEDMILVRRFSAY